jgi:hypothetical protein
VTVQWFSLGTPIISTNKTDHHDIAEILLKVALSTIILSPLIVFNIENRIHPIYMEYKQQAEVNLNSIRDYSKL